MNMINIYGIFIFIIVVIASVSCESSNEKCSNEGVKACVQDNTQERNKDCVNYEKAIQCLKALQTTCAGDDKVQESTEYILMYFRQRIPKCQNLPEGTCYHSEMLKCIAGVPEDLDLVTFDLMSEQDKRSKCKIFKGEFNKLTKCLEKLRDDCNSERASDHLLGTLENFVKIYTTCSKF